jgi:hypothetical protein
MYESIRSRTGSAFDFGSRDVQKAGHRGEIGSQMQPEKDAKCKMQKESGCFDAGA